MALPAPFYLRLVNLVLGTIAAAAVLLLWILVLPAALLAAPLALWPPARARLRGALAALPSFPAVACDCAAYCIDCALCGLLSGMDDDAPEDYEAQQERTKRVLCCAGT